MAVPDGRRDDDEDGAALFEEEGVEFADDDDIDHFEIPIHLRPLVSAAESGNLDALRQALGNCYSLWRRAAVVNSCAFSSFHMRFPTGFSSLRG